MFVYDFFVENPWGLAWVWVAAIWASTYAPGRTLLWVAGSAPLWIPVAIVAQPASFWALGMLGLRWLLHLWQVKLHTTSTGSLRLEVVQRVRAGLLCAAIGLSLFIAFHVLLFLIGDSLLGNELRLRFVSILSDLDVAVRALLSPTLLLIVFLVVFVLTMFIHSSRVAVAADAIRFRLGQVMLLLTGATAFTFAVGGNGEVLLAQHQTQLLARLELVKNNTRALEADLVAAMLLEEKINNAAPQEREDLRAVLQPLDGVFLNVIPRPAVDSSGSTTRIALPQVEPLTSTRGLPEAVGRAMVSGPFEISDRASQRTSERTLSLTTLQAQLTESEARLDRMRGLQLAARNAVSTSLSAMLPSVADTTLRLVLNEALSAVSDRIGRASVQRGVDSLAATRLRLTASGGSNGRPVSAGWDWTSKALFGEAITDAASVDRVHRKLSRQVAAAERLLDPATKRLTPTEEAARRAKALVKGR